MKSGKGSVYSTIQSDEKLNKLYFIHKKLSNGCFGYLFLVTNKFTNRKSALKVQMLKNQSIMTLKRQYQFLKKLEGIKGIPTLYNFGKTDNLYYIELELLETDINFLTGKSIKPDVNYIFEIAASVLEILEKVHAKNIIHRDIKPQNIMLDKNKNIYLIDFGISREMSGRNIMVDRRSHSFVGTPRYASISAHKGKEQLPVDDIESLMYNLIFLLKKTLPWMNINVEDQKKLETILAIKVKKTKAELCRDLPKQILLTFQYLNKLKQNEKINYKYLIQLFRTNVPTEIKTEVITANTSQSTKVIQNNNKSRRTSLESNCNLLQLPFLDIQQFSGMGSANTFKPPASEQAMISSDQMSDCKNQIECNIDENIDNQQTVDSKIKALEMNHITPKFNLLFH